jgi:hypothetical protein
VVVLIVVEVRLFFMVIYNHKDDDKFKIRYCICYTSYKNIQNINYGNNDQDLLSLISQSHLRNCSSLYSLSNNCLRLHHQNINNTDELICSLSPISPYIHCLTGHHLQDPELDSIFFMHYNLTTKFSW